MAVARGLGGGAAGAQEDLKITGHAIEARLYAEDVPAGFLPATGRLEHLRFGEGARADTGVGPGDEISPWYDPMIAKLIVHGADAGDRAEADGPRAGHDRGGGGDDEPRLPARLVGHGRFASGDVDTGLIEADLDALVAPPPTPAAVIARAALAAMGLDGAGAAHRVQPLGAVAAERAFDAGGTATEVVVELRWGRPRAASSARRGEDDDATRSGMAAGGRRPDPARGHAAGAGRGL
jgi:3-methylcrotonyl-CoA carboxylase alpha subunit